MRSEAKQSFPITPPRADPDNPGFRTFTVGGFNRPAPRCSASPKGMRVMTTLRYLPLLILAWASIAAAGDDRQDAMGTDARGEIAEILAQPSIGLDDLFLIAELANPDLAMARLDVSARAGRLRQAGLYPNPELSFSVDERSLENPVSEKRKVELSQALPIGGRHGAAVQAARAEVDRAREVAIQKRREILGRVHRWWVDQIHFREIGTEIDALTAEAERTLEIARARFDVKAAPEAHVTRAMLEVYDLETARQELESRRVWSAAEAKVLLGGVEVPTDRLRGSLDPGDSTAGPAYGAATGLDAHPTLRAARYGVEAAEAELATARKERVPDLNVFVAYGSARPDEDDFVEGGISLSLPLFDRNQGRIAETATRVARAHHEERLAVNELSASLSSARSNRRSANEQLDRLLGEIVPAAERSLAQTREAYRTGRLAFLDLVDAQRTYKDVRQRILSLRRDLALAEADLMGLLGAGPYADEGEER
jgi:outer membrane protein, heavy metal efflux system